MSDLQALKDEYLDHMMNPRNYGKIHQPDAIGRGKNPQNDEMVEIYMKIDAKSIKEISFMAIGCMSTIVTGSVFTDMIKGESLQEAVSVAEEFVGKLKDAPQSQRACAEMVAKAFFAAVINFDRKKEGKEEESYTLIISEDCTVDEDR